MQTTIPPWSPGRRRWRAITAVIRRSRAPALLWLAGGLIVASAVPAAGFEPQSDQQCLQASVRIKTTDHAGQDTYGCGFLLNEGDATYLYTNAHVLDGADKIEIVDHRGASLTGFEWIESLAEPCGRYQDGPCSGDAVRLKCGQRREVALTLTSDWTSLRPGRNLLVLSDSDGANPANLTDKTLPGTTDILHHDFKTQARASGGAVVDAATFKVVAVSTWGTLPAKRADPYQRMLGMAGTDGTAFGIVLQHPEWQRFPTKDYLAQQKTIQRYRQTLELMVLLSYLVPTANGLQAKHKDLAVPLRAEIHAASTAPFVAGLTLGDAIRHHQDDPRMKRLFELCDKNIKISNADLFKIYLAALDAVLKDRQTLAADLRKVRLSYYYQSLLTRQLLTAGDAHYGAWLAACQAWFKQKLSYGGTIPLKEWQTLPPYGATLAKEIRRKLRDE